MIAASEIENMDFVDKLKTMEMLWDWISSKPEQVKSPKWHGEIIAERLAQIKRGDAKFFTIEEVKKRLRKKRA